MGNLIYSPHSRYQTISSTLVLIYSMFTADIQKLNRLWLADKTDIVIERHQLNYRRNFSDNIDRRYKFKKYRMVINGTLLWGVDNKYMVTIIDFTILPDKGIYLSTELSRVRDLSFNARANFIRYS